MRLALILVLSISFFATDLNAQESGRKSTPEVPGQNDQAKRQGDRKKMQQRRGQRGQRGQRFNPRALFERMDKNNDKVLTVDEVPQRMQERMANVDADRNDKVTLKEFVTAMRKRMQGQAMQRGSKGKPGEKGAAKGKGKAGRLGKGQIPTAEDMLARLDRNFDQVLSEDEVPERMRKKFSEMDKNGDNQLDPKELVSVVERLKAAKESKGGRYDTDPEKAKGTMPKRPPRDG